MIKSVLTEVMEVDTDFSSDLVDLRFYGSFNSKGAHLSFPLAFVGNLSVLFRKTANAPR